MDLPYKLNLFGRTEEIWYLELNFAEQQDRALNTLNPGISH